MDDILSTLYNAFDPTPLAADDADQGLYVELDPFRGESGSAAERIARTFAFTRKPKHLLLAGHKGCGKSTEIRRIARILESGEPKFFVVVCEGQKELDLTDVDLPEILVAMLRTLAHELKHRRGEDGKELGIDLNPGYLKDRLGEIWKTLTSEVRLEGLSVDAGLGELAMRMKSGPTERDRLRAGINERASGWLQAANDFVGEALLALGKKGYKRLLLVMDDLDKLILQVNEKHGCHPGEYLFLHRAAQLAGIGTHVLYTVPIDLHYSHLGPRIESAFGEKTRVIPMVKIRHRPPASKPHPEGKAALRNLVERRIARIGLAPGEAIEDDALEFLIDRSGGQPSELLNFVKDATIRIDALPIDLRAAEQVEREHRRSYEASLTLGNSARILRAVAETGAPPSDADESVFRELLASRAILRYMNDEGWFAVNPLVAIPPSPA